MILIELVCIGIVFVVIYLFCNRNEEGRQQFYRDAALYFENGLIHEIYHTKNYSICNFANYGYALFFYPLSKKTKEAFRTLGPVGIFLSTDYIKELIMNPGSIFKLNEVDRDELNKLKFRLSQKNLSRAMEIKAERDMNGPTTRIDLEMEKVLLAARETGSRPDVNHPVFDVTHQSVEKQNKAD